MDRKATLQAYAETSIGSADSCKCLFCRNFVAARESIYPDEFRTLLERLGIDYRKDAEIWEASPDGSCIRFYSGWFHFIGTIVSLNEQKKPSHHTLRQTNTKLLGGEELIGDSFALSFKDKADLAHPSFKGHSLVQLEFSVEVPWVLNELPDT
ncbi:MAG: hypothetical protein ACYC27_05250 [Armatimonadota bacterium]